MSKITVTQRRMVTTSVMASAKPVLAKDGELCGGALTTENGRGHRNTPVLPMDATAEQSIWYDWKHTPNLKAWFPGKFRKLPLRKDDGNAPSDGRSGGILRNDALAHATPAANETPGNGDVTMVDSATKISAMLPVVRGTYPAIDFGGEIANE